MKQKFFYIIGCQRSGTTLLRLILDSHTKISCIDETRAYDLLSDSTKINQILKNEQNSGWIGFKIPRFTEQITNQTLYDYGLSSPISHFYQNEPLIFIVRDCRDTICSMRNLKGQDNTSWLNAWGIQILNYWIKQSPEFKKKFEIEIQKVQNSKYHDISSAALYWKFKNMSYFTYQNLGLPIIKIHYEELVTNPKPIIQKLIDFLNLKWEDSLMNHHTLNHSEVDVIGITIGSTDARMPISTFHIGQYLKELDHDQLKEISSIAGDMMKLFGYV